MRRLLAIIALAALPVFAADIEHEEIDAGNIHEFCDFVWDDDSARTSWTGDANDVGKCGRQTDTGQIWWVQSNVGPVLQLVSGKVVTHATDCTGLTGYALGDVCGELDDNTLYVCESADCDGSGWVAYGSSGSGAFDDTGDPVVLNSTGKDVTIGPAGGPTTEPKLHVSGDTAAQVQFAVTPHASQSEDVVSICGSWTDETCDERWFRVSSGGQVSINRDETVTGDIFFVRGQATYNYPIVVEEDGVAFGLINSTAVAHLGVPVSGNAQLEFEEFANCNTSPSCAAGRYFICADTDSSIYACADGTLFALGSGSGALVETSDVVHLITGDEDLCENSTCASGNWQIPNDGNAVFETVSTADQTDVGGTGNAWTLRDNAVNLTTDPTCALAGTAEEFSLRDVDDDDSGAGEDIWAGCDGTSEAFRFSSSIGMQSHKFNVDGTTCLDTSGDRLFHDTDCDGTKDAGEEFIDQAGGGGGTQSHCFKISNPPASAPTVYESVWRAPAAITITALWCEVDDGLSTTDVQILRDDGSAANIFSGDLSCTNAAAGAEQTNVVGTEDNVADGERIDVEVAVIDGDTTWISICWEYTVD